MTKTTYKNEQIKREFLEHLKGAEGFAESSVNAFAEAIDKWQTFTNADDFENFNNSKAIAFRDWLKLKETKTKSGKLSITTQYNYLRRVKKFFKWLSREPGYKSKILKNDVEFLRLSKGDTRIAQQGTTRQMPTFEEVKIIIKSIRVENEIDMRDRAIICFALITGIRISALISLRMKSFDINNKLIDQNPADGVKTKNSKRILTTFFPIGWDDPRQYFIEWYKYLESKNFKPDDPIFPSTMNNFTVQKYEYSKKFVDNKFWVGTGGARKIFDKRCRMVDLPYFNPHSFRHLIVNILSEARLTEEEKKAISLNLGHANIGTTFGSYGYGNMNGEDAVRIVKELKDPQNVKNPIISKEERDFFNKILDKLS